MLVPNYRKTPQIKNPWDVLWHCTDVRMSVSASQITSLTIVYSTVYSGADQRKHQSSASLAFVWGIHQSPVNSQHNLSIWWCHHGINLGSALLSLCAVKPSHQWFLCTQRKSKLSHSHSHMASRIYSHLIVCAHFPNGVINILAQWDNSNVKNSAIAWTNWTVRLFCY